MSNTQRIIDHGYSSRVDEIAKMNHLFTKVGLPENGEVGQSTQPGSGHDAATYMSEIIAVGAVHEFGAPEKNIPERPFIRTSFDDNFQALQEFKKTQAALVIEGKQTAAIGIAKIGEWMTNKTKLKINSNIPPKLSPFTIKRKHSSRSLIDTGQMINSIQHAEAYV